MKSFREARCQQRLASLANRVLKSHDDLFGYRPRRVHIPFLLAWSEHATQISSSRQQRCRNVTQHARRAISCSERVLGRLVIEVGEVDPSSIDQYAPE